MAIVTIGHSPDLTADEAMAAFAKRFLGKYQVNKTKILRRDFIVQKSAWSGVGVQLKQEQDKTSFVFTALIPHPLLRALFSGLVPYLFLRSRWKELEDEMASYIEHEKEFRAPALAAAA